MKNMPILFDIFLDDRIIILIVSSIECFITAIFSTTVFITVVKHIKCFMNILKSMIAS